MPSSDSEEEGFGDYQKNLREKANRSIQQLSQMLGDNSSSTESMEQNRGPDTDSTSGDNSWNHLRPSDAVNQLRSLLQKQHKAASPGKRKPQSQAKASDEEPNLSAMQELVPILHNQSEYIQHLEAEVKFCKEELQGMKHRIRVVVVENEKLHEELKNKVVEDTLKDYSMLEVPTEAAGLVVRSPSKHAPIRPKALEPSHKWQNELEQLKLLHQAQTETLKSQVTSLRTELVSAAKENAELKLQLRETVVSEKRRLPPVGGLCLRCAQREAAVPEVQERVQKQAVERLTRERDELMEVLSSLRASQAEAQQKEWAAYLQVKQALEMSEEANLEKTKALVQCDQAYAEIARLRERLEQELAAKQVKITQAKEEARGEARKEKEELLKMAEDLSQRVAELEGQLDRGDRERNSVSAQLEEVLRKLSSQEAESSQLCGQLRYQLSQAQLKREEAERELKDTSNRMAQQLEQAGQEAERLSLELSGCRRRLETAQRDADGARAEALSLTERLGHTRHQLHLTRKEKEALQRGRNEDIAAMTLKVEQRERELKGKLDHAQNQHQQSMSELEGILSSQSALIIKLKEECHNLGSQLEELTVTSRVELDELTLEKEHLQESVQKLQGRCQEMEEQCVQHGRMHQRMKHRLKQLDQHCQSSAQQVVELLSRQNQLMQERQEMQKLHMQLPPAAGRET